jgi:hypothetical protein
VLRHRTSWGRINAEAEGIYRSARDFRWDSRNIGHDARGEVTVGDDARGIGVGGRLYDVVAPVEDWHVGDAENGFASFFLHRDFRDHYDRHGGAGWIRAFAGEELELRLSLADERWGNRGELDPWTLFRDDARWRPNPTLDEGRFHLATAMLHFDSRNDVDRPWSGWYAHTEVERGTGAITSAGGTADAGDRISSGRTDWVRGFIDVRKYSRLAPNTLLNLRLVTGGWLGGDALPLNRRLSLGGAGSLPGYDFRGDALPTTVCSGFVDVDDEQGQVVDGTARGVPANCERIALAQVEYRTDLNLNLDLFNRPSRFLRIRRVGQWVLFANSGRGWLVGPRVGELQYRAGQFPTLSTFRTDIGGGLDFGRLGFYIAKSVSDGDEPPNFFVRLRRRF